MSEKLTPKSKEKPERSEIHDTKEQSERLGETLKEDAEKARNQHERSKEAKEASKSAEKLAKSSKEQALKKHETSEEKQPVTRGVKKQTYRATMNRVEAKLPAYQRTFSRVINNDFVDKASNVAGKTVARPSALLGGGITAFVGLVIVTYYANKIGFEVSGGTFVLLVAAGWVAGLVVEGAYKAIRRLLK